MPLSEAELLERDARRDLGAELLEAIRQVKAGQVGAVRLVPITEAAAARARLGLSQSRFARVLGVSVRTPQEWEQGRRQPSGAARALLRIAATRPEVVHDALLAD